ncbi:MAG: cyanophycinase [Chloroflexota bacterium]
MKRLLPLLLLLLFTAALSARAQTKPGLLLPIGAGYTDTYNAVGQYAVANARGDTVHILVLASPYATNPGHITQAEFQQNMKDAGERRIQLEGACQRNLPAGSALTCKVDLLPIFTREDALKPENLAYFTDDVAMIYILGGGQEEGMGAILGTPVEERINELHAQGTIIAGTSAGAAMLSRVMLLSLQTNYGTEDGLFFGAMRLWNSDTLRGFDFGVRNAVLDQHFMQRARMGRLLSVITQPGLPHLGVGIDAYTGVVVEDETLRDVFGLYTVAVLDAETYHAADAVRYVTFDTKKPPIISVRNVLLHLMSPGDFSYDLKTRAFSFGKPAPQTIERTLDLAIPQGAGPLLLAGDLSETLKDSPILDRFVELSGGQNAVIVVMSEGGASTAANERFAKKYADALAALGAQTRIWTPDETGNYPGGFPADATAFVFAGKDASKMRPPALLEEAWRSGKPILADNAAVPLFGAFYSAHGPTPADAEQEEIAVQRSFWQGRTVIQPGLGWLNVTLEPQLFADLRFGRLFSLAYNHPELPAIGLNQNTALEITAEGARVLGENGIFVLDLRHAQRTLGTNEGFVIANALLDVFAPGETLQLEPADVNAVYQPQPTPALPTLPPTATPEPAAESTSTPLPAAVTALPASPTPNYQTPDYQTPASPIPWGILIGLALIIGAWIIFRRSARRK